MSSIGPNWDSSWTATSINGGNLTNGSTDTTTTAISHTGSPGKAGTAISVTVGYNASTATQGLLVYVAKEVDGGYELIGDEPQGVVLPYAVNTTFHRLFTVLGTECPSFKVIVKNSSGGTITVTVKYKQYEIESA